MGQPAEEPINANEEREDSLTEDLVNLWKISLRDHVCRESHIREIPEEVIWDRLEVNDEVNHLLNRMPRLLARHFIILQDLQEEEARERRRQQIVQRCEDRNKREEEERDTSRCHTSGNQQ